MDKQISELESDLPLTDNTKIEDCKQCIDCTFRNEFTFRNKKMNGYQKSFCVKFKMKPLYVILNKKDCDLYQKEK